MQHQEFLDTTRPWYQCQRCGNCCRWPGDVHVTDAEISKIAAHLGLAENDFIQRFCRVNARRDGLSIDDHPDGSCLFLKGENECLIQPVKPVHCRGFPNAWNFPGWREKCEAIEVSSVAPA